MIVTTTDSVEGRPVKSYLAIVSGEAFLLDDSSDGASEKEDALLGAREKAIGKMTQRAEKLGANAVVGVSVDVEIQSAMKYFVTVAGTAVVLP
ncbi:MAG TPA: heavy metal-binding domain-containing protein [Planctomycetota bacterium]|nr:heavy metal-binding domain-containing protein [Planctomycetota bacterium]